jgi:hypothetical protein
MKCGLTVINPEVLKMTFVMKTYNGDYYFTDLEDVPTETLKLREMALLKEAEHYQDLADRTRYEANKRRQERNYRKHIELLKPLRDRDACPEPEQRKLV